MNKGATKKSKPKPQAFRSVEEVRQRFFPNAPPTLDIEDDETAPSLGVTLRLTTESLQKLRTEGRK